MEHHESADSGSRTISNDDVIYQTGGRVEQDKAKGDDLPGRTLYVDATHRSAGG
jgi:hypothetical protein